MQEGYVSSAACVAAGFWVASVAAMLAVWVGAIDGLDRDLLIAAATTACFTAMIAATCHIRYYLWRLGRTIRTTAGLEEDRPRVHAVR